MKNKIYTYFDELSNENDIKLLSLWKDSWQKNGFDTIVLNEGDAKKSSYYDEFVVEIKKIHMDVCGSEISNRSLSGYLRWLAYSTQEENESFFVSDLDVVNRCMTVDEIKVPKDEITFLNVYDPCLVYANKDQFLSFCKDIVSVSIENKEFLKDKQLDYYHDTDFLWLNRKKIKLNYNISRGEQYVGSYSMEYESLAKYKIFQVTEESIDLFISHSPGLNKVNRENIKNQLITEILQEGNKYLNGDNKNKQKSKIKKIPVYLNLVGSKNLMQHINTLFRKSTKQNFSRGEKKFLLNSFRITLINTDKTDTKNKLPRLTKPIATIFLQDPFRKLIKEKKDFKKEARNNDKHYFCDIDCFTEHLKTYDFDIFCIILRPPGIPFIHEIDKIVKISGGEMLRYTSLQYPLNDAGLFYNRCVKTITGTTGLATQEVFDNATKFLDTFKVAKVEKIDELVNEVFSESHGISLDTNELRKIKRIANRRNRTIPPKTLPYYQLDDELKKYILDGATFDLKLYNKYCPPEEIKNLTDIKK
jgi:hypothetical protein